MRFTRASRNTADPQVVITASHLTKQFGVEFAVNDASFEVPRGKIFGFIGPSGSGKTTLVRLLTGILIPTAGEAHVLGRHPAHFNQQTRELIGYMPQLFVLYPDLSVWENLNFAASIYGMGLRRGKRLKSVLEFVELYEHRGKLARNISGGMQRRLSLAATLVHDPQLIFLDEPTAGIDPVLRRKFWDHFKDLQNAGRTLFITTQYVGEAAYCDLVGVMALGRLLMVETPIGLRRRAYGGDVVVMKTVDPVPPRTGQDMRKMPNVMGPVTQPTEREMRVVVGDASTAIPDLLEWSKQQGINVEKIEQYLPPYDDVFVELVKGQEENEPTA
jgi:ABC-2 type transport system ATP-binding protein